MRRRVPLPLVAVAVTVVVAALVAAAFWLLRDRPVEVAAPPSAADPACSTLAERLPDRVGTRTRRTTSSDSPAVAAWGDPAIVWLCGVAQPGPSTECLDISGVDWVVESLDDGTAFTTFGRDPAVQVLVPAAYAPEPLLLPPFSRVMAAIEQGSRRCT